MSSRLIILNASCFDALDAQREWLSSHNVEVIADRKCLSYSDAEFDAALSGANAIICPAIKPIREEHMRSNPELQVISFASSGYEAADIEAATRLGVVVTNTIVSIGSDVVADHAWGLMLALSRQVPYHHELLRQGSKVRGMGVAVSGKTLGVVGLGNIGRAVARRAAGFDMRILATGLNPDQEFVERHQIELVELDELLRKSDFVSLHLRLSSETKNIIGRRELSLMKPTAFLINTARDELVDETALAETIVQERIAGVALDDPIRFEENRHLMERPNVICTPHLGNRAIEGVQAVTRASLQNAVDVLEGKHPQGLVNPEVYGPQLRATMPVSVGQ